MHNSRRKFIPKGLATAATVSVLPQVFLSCTAKQESKASESPSTKSRSAQNTYFDHIGVQLYTARDAFAADGKATLEQIAKIGGVQGG